MDYAAMNNQIMMEALARGAIAGLLYILLMMCIIAVHVKMVRWFGIGGFLFMFAFDFSFLLFILLFN
jgi:hypothetical protein